jgi:glycosyltransferase involved in cell wall biosynthesis
MKNLNIMTPINDLGYGIAGKNICKSLKKEGYNVSIFPIGEPSFSSQEEADELSLMLKEGASFDVEAPCIKIWHEYDMAQRIGRGRFIGFPFFEINKFNEIRQHQLSSCDDVFVASEWAKEVINKEVPSVTTHVVPLGVDTDLFSPLDRSTSLPDNDKFIFFNCGKWEKRKGHDLLLLLFQQAFKDEDDVELWMMCQNPFLPPEEAVKWTTAYSRDPRVRLIDRVQSQQNMIPILQQVRCGIFPSRAEGWNLEILELMSMGKHVITTDYSAHTEYCDASNSMLVKPLKEEPAHDGIWFDGSAEWASLEGVEEQFIDHMRSIYKKWKTGEYERNEEGIDTAFRYRWEVCAKRIKELLDEGQD